MAFFSFFQFSNLSNSKVQGFFTIIFISQSSYVGGEIPHEYISSPRLKLVQCKVSSSSLVKQKRWKIHETREIQISCWFSNHEVGKKMLFCFNHFRLLVKTPS